MKKEDAEKLICPFIQYGSSKNQSHNINCITDKCMAWQKVTKYNDLKEYLADTCDQEFKEKKFKELGKDFIFISAKSRMYDVLVKFGIPSKAELGYCKRLQND